MNSIGALQPQVISGPFFSDARLANQLLEDINALPKNEPQRSFHPNDLQEILSLVQRFIEFSEKDQELIKDYLLKESVQVVLFIAIIELMACHQEVGQIFLDHLTLMGAGDRTVSLRNLYSALSEVRDIFHRDLLQNLELCKNLSDLCHALDRSLGSAFLPHDSIQQFGELLKVSAELFYSPLSEDIKNDPKYIGDHLIEGCISGNTIIQQYFSFCPNDINTSLKHVSRKALYWYAEKNEVATPHSRTLLVAIRPDMSQTDALMLEMLYIGKKGKKQLALQPISHDLYTSQSKNLVEYVKETPIGKRSDNIIFINVEAEKIEQLAESYYTNHMIAQEIVAQIKGLNLENSEHALLEEIVNILKKSDPLDELELGLLIKHINDYLIETNSFIGPIKKLLEILREHRELGELFLEHLVLVAGNENEESLRHLYLALSQVQEIYSNDLKHFADTCKAIALSCTELCEGLQKALPKIEFDHAFDQLIGTSAYIIYSQVPSNIKKSPYYFGEALLKAYAVGSQYVSQDVALNVKNIRKASSEICRNILTNYAMSRAIEPNGKKDTVVVLVRPSSSRPAASREKKNYMVFEELHISKTGHTFRSVWRSYTIDGKGNACFTKKSGEVTQNFGAFIVDRFKRKSVVVLNLDECEIEAVADLYYKNTD